MIRFWWFCTTTVRFWWYISAFRELIACHVTSSLFWTSTLFCLLSACTIVVRVVVVATVIMFITMWKQANRRNVRMLCVREDEILRIMRTHVSSTAATRTDGRSSFCGWIRRRHRQRRMQVRWEIRLYLIAWSREWSCIIKAWHITTIRWSSTNQCLSRIHRWHILIIDITVTIAIRVLSLMVWISCIWPWAVPTSIKMIWIQRRVMVYGWSRYWS